MAAMSIEPSVTQPQSQPHRPSNAGVYAAAFACAVVVPALESLIPRVLAFAPLTEQPFRIAPLTLVALVIGGGIAMVGPTRASLATAMALSGPAVLGAWFSIDAAPSQRVLAVVMMFPFVLLGTTLACAFWVARVWKVYALILAGTAGGLAAAAWLRDLVGTEAMWFLLAAIAATASLAQLPYDRGKWRWVIGFVTAPAAVMLACIQLGTSQLDIPQIEAFGDALRRSWVRLAWPVPAYGIALWVLVAVRRRHLLPSGAS